MQRAFILPLAGLLAVLSLGAAAPARAAEDHSDVPADLRDADYITARDVSAKLPHGELEIREAVFAIFPGMDRRLGGMLIDADATVRLDDLPADGLSRFDASRRGRPVRFEVERAYLSASLTSGAGVLPSGKALAVRRWSTLSRTEREEFLALYESAARDGWAEPGAADSDGDGAPDLLVRDPRGREFFSAFWAEPVKLAEGEDLAPGTFDPRKPGDPVRYDYRVDASGREVSILDRALVLAVFTAPAPTLKPTDVPKEPDTAPASPEEAVDSSASSEGGGGSNETGNG